MLNQIDLSRVDLNLLVLFEIVLEERHVGQAAEKLNLSPSAVSHGLGRLRRLLNDPLFLRTPKGVVPTDRALDLAEPVADILARARSVIATAEPFDPATSTRRFTIGAPDGVSAVFLSPLLAELRRLGPSIDISVRQVLPPRTVRTTDGVWEPVLADIEARAVDIAVVPADGAPARFTARTLYEEDFVIAMRAGHPFGKDPTLDAFCRMQHLVVSLTGDAYGFVDDILGEHGYSRRVALTVPNFMFALAVIAETDLIAALPKTFVAMYAPRFGVVSAEAPLPLIHSRIRAITSKAALMDAGVAWLFNLLGRPVKPADVFG
ncbi:MAG: LysR family transcriptional regulator [Mesorhizobium sp.]|uniref:LysR family transcriptional regulator n=1 Tax=Mesorhizobium sp. TaxID=1871066 RepID=UPI000FE6DEF9|nr:LysR family transcriptional regulator [Mesorhizobium sp.]RWM88879.1 MAG: LysR family transcriptional regulator [Mesorhizobium sp.]